MKEDPGWLMLHEYSVRSKSAISSTGLVYLLRVARVTLVLALVTLTVQQ
jgi:hypothetical protein